MGTYSKSLKTKQRIFDVAYGLFAQKGYTTTSLSDIAKAADVSTGTLYRYYPTKGDFLMQIRHDSVTRLREVAKEIPASLPLDEQITLVAQNDLLGVLLASSIDYELERDAEMDLTLASFSETYASYERFCEEREIRSQLCSIYRELIEHAQGCGDFDPSVDAQLLAQIVTAIFFQELDLLIYDDSHDFKESFQKKVRIILGMPNPQPRAENQLVGASRPSGEAAC